MMFFNRLPRDTFFENLIFKYKKHTMRQLYQTASSFHFLYVNKNCIKLIFSHFNGAIQFSQIKTGHYIKRTKEEGLFTTSRLRGGCFPVNLLHIFRKPFPENTSEWLLLLIYRKFFIVSSMSCATCRLSFIFC